MIETSRLHELLQFVLVGLGPGTRLIVLITTLTTLQALPDWVLVLRGSRSDLGVIALILEDLSTSGHFLNAAGSRSHAVPMPNCWLAVLSLLLGSQSAIRLVVRLGPTHIVVKVLALRDGLLAHYALEPLRDKLMRELR